MIEQADQAHDAMRRSLPPSRGMLIPALCGCMACDTVRMIAAPVLGACPGCGAALTVLGSASAGRGPAPGLAAPDPQAAGPCGDTGSRGSTRPPAARASRLIDETLAGIEIFRDLPPHALQALSQSCRLVRYGAHQTILQCQDQSRDVFFVVRGRVSVLYYSASGHEVRICELPQGEIFGDFAAIDGEPRSTDVVTASDALIARMSADMFWDVLRHHPPAAAAMLRRLTRIIRTTLQRVVEFSTLPVRSRIHAELLRLGRASAPDPCGRTAVIFPAPTHAAIAARISTHREAVTRELNELARAGVIAKTGGALVIRDMTVLSGMLGTLLENHRPKPRDRREFHDLPLAAGGAASGRALPAGADPASIVARLAMPRAADPLSPITP